MDYPAYKGIPNLLRKYREVTGLTQKVLAGHLGVDPTWLSRWERGETLPNLISAIRISVVLNISVNELFSELESDIRAKLSEDNLRRATDQTRAN